MSRPACEVQAPVRMGGQAVGSDVSGAGGDDKAGWVPKGRRCWVATAMLPANSGRSGPAKVKVMTRAQATPGVHRLTAGGPRSLLFGGNLRPQAGAQIESFISILYL